MGSDTEGNRASRESKYVDRRRFIQATAVGASLGLAGCTSEDGDGDGDSTETSGGTTGAVNNQDLGDELSLFSWGAAYADPQFVEPFEEEYDCEITVETFTSNADAVNKIRASPEGTYDVVQPTNYAVERMMQQDMLEPLRLDNIPAYEEHVYDAMKLDAYEADNNVYAVPQTFGVTGLMYRTDGDFEVQSPPSLDILWNSDFEGRISTRDNTKAQIFYGAIKTGQDPNDPSDLDAIEDALMEHVGLVRTFWSSGTQAQEVMQSGEVDLMLAWDGDYRTIQDGTPVGFTGFQEGTKGWLDNQSVVKGATNRALAEKWIDYCVSDAARDWFELNGYAIPSSAADYSEEERQTYNLDEESLQSYIFQGMVSDEDQQQYDEIWTRVKNSA